MAAPLQSTFNKQVRQKKGAATLLCALGGENFGEEDEMTVKLCIGGRVVPLQAPSGGSSMRECNMVAIFLVVSTADFCIAEYVNNSL